MDRERHVDNGGWVSADEWWGLNPDGESEDVWGVWGVVDARPADSFDSESADKSPEGPLFPGR